MEEKKRKIMLDELMSRLNSDTYDTPKEKKRVFLDKLFLGSRVYFIIRYVAITLYLSNKARKGKFHYDEYMELGFRCFNLLEDVGGKFHIEGIDNIKAVLDEPVVFVGNHMSALETMILPGIILPIKNVIFVVKKSLLTFPVFGHIMRKTKPIAVGRVNPREDLKTVMSEGIEILKSGTSIIIFQQSHRNPNFDPEVFSSLGVKLAQKAGVKVVPFALKTDFWGNSKLVRDFGPIRRKEKVHFAFDEPMEIKGNGKENNEQIIKFINENLKKWGHNPNPDSL